MGDLGALDDVVDQSDERLWGETASGRDEIDAGILRGPLWIQRIEFQQADHIVNEIQNFFHRQLLTLHYQRLKCPPRIDLTLWLPTFSGPLPKLFKNFVHCGALLISYFGFCQNFEFLK